MIRTRLPTCLALAATLSLAGVAAARAQILLYSQRLPEGTVYVRLASALPAASSIATDFAGTVALGATGADRISPYFVAGKAGDKTVTLQVTQNGHQATATFTPKSGSFVTVVLHGTDTAVTAAVVTDKPEYNQLKARLTFYNATPDCAAGSLSEGTGRPVFSAVPPDGVQARSINPVTTTVTAACASGKAPAVPLGQVDPGGLYTVWLMRAGSGLTAFVARDTIAPPRS